jgi:predicted enzyme related to lactoylglutathione lyase
MNHFIWYDLMTPNVKQVISFYEKVVGWTIADSGMPGMDYNIISAGDVMVGGIMPPPPETGGMRPPWHGHIWSQDVDADCKRVKDLGGNIHQQPEDIPGIGRFAVVSDPGNASFILFKPSSTEEPKPVAPGMPGHIGWRELHAEDLGKAWAFYEKLFGWKKAGDMPMPDGNSYQLFSTGRSDMDGGMMTKDKSTPQPMWLYYFNVGNIDEAAERVRKAGGKVTQEPMEVPGGQWVINASDPEQHLFGLLGSK